MTGADIRLINRIWRESFKQQKKNKLFDCPFTPMKYSSTSGKMKKERVECQYGKGVWCQFCARHTRWQKQQSASKKAYLNKKIHMLTTYDKTGLIPHLRTKPNPQRVTDPFGGYL